MSRSMAEVVVLVLASKRLTRLVTTDWLGEWLLIRPAKKWAYDREGAVDVHLLPELLEDGSVVDPTRGFWRTKAVSGLDCDWCVGVWAAAFVSLPLPARLDRLRRPLLTALAVAQGVGMLAQLEHVAASKIDEAMYVMEDDPT